VWRGEAVILGPRGHCIILWLCAVLVGHIKLLSLHEGAFCEVSEKKGSSSLCKVVSWNEVPCGVS